ncbi:unnamed protein product [Didymodactylos carnosus]|uniref:Uncharacterized protein n=1 Tax=Didymodactylos carnosus TaxID=1234261 RepID=A0A814ASH6_9BILA|nr:unnamed protein product [Didymodactylos carnosus]CAF0916954.1 unnamed protein product [Didymodactylos carnosus]CAF3587390.1 unnamed protein product [Didymodactylos carnosus]CAF3696980.1 unnamed protein product [Didymodactylos carnosus]
MRTKNNKHQKKVVYEKKTRKNEKEPKQQQLHYRKNAVLFINEHIHKHERSIFDIPLSLLNSENYSDLLVLLTLFQLPPDILKDLTESLLRHIEQKDE